MFAAPCLKLCMIELLSYSSSDTKSSSINHTPDNNLESFFNQAPTRIGDAGHEGPQQGHF